MVVNLNKCATQTFSLMHRPIIPNLSFSGTMLENVDSFTYLGTVFDSKLSWRNHVAFVAERVIRRLPILKRLAGTLWGCARSTLALTYQKYILPIFTYCSEPLISMPTSLLQKLEVLQNQALRLITGAVKTTPIDAMTLLTGIKPLDVVFRERAVLLYFKLTQMDNFWTNYQLTPRNLKTQNGFIQTVKDQLVGIDLPQLEGQVELVSPLDYQKINVRLSLEQDIVKSETSTAALHLLALETMGIRYPEPLWLRVFTDGSFHPDQPNAGAGISCNLFSFGAPVGANRSAFDGEVVAIRIALEQLFCFIESFSNVVILSDSKAALCSIESMHCPSNCDVLKCQDAIRKLHHFGKTVALQWIPGHCDIAGNERADVLAKRGTRILQALSSPVPFSALKRIIRSKIHGDFHQQLSERVKTKVWRDLRQNTIPDWPRREAVAQFRLHTGHDCLAAHLFRLGLAPDPYCSLCMSQAVLDGSHILCCRALRGSSSTERYWEARALLWK
nr:uncharacterized protein LOC110282416 [Parasteatoda tepidariorum]